MVHSHHLFYYFYCVLINKGDISYFTPDEALIGLKATGVFPPPPYPPDLFLAKLNTKNRRIDTYKDNELLSQARELSLIFQERLMKSINLANDILKAKNERFHVAQTMKEENQRSSYCYSD
ncbi:hypothetical protein VP01_4834g1 [Puccinia sorghi]|uniref:Uncharacterized protein n=1 Tax=Puccinia sorghi TaxID=27349 RepID=A0A0L6UME6_9BASI|nr:hypothetical protein VP01_4834g1 [Puccinia sorghi]